ncbi:MAG: CoA transferase [Burkholderiales bacterium]|nr:CoA transferase [Burkholderiales bacterium]
MIRTAETAHSTAPAVAPPAPLRGVRVVEFTHMVMGPMAGLVLADLGADVLKIEPVEGDRTRHLLGAGIGFFPLFNRNKASLGIDLKHAEGAALARRLALSADVVIENFKPGALDKLGLGYEALAAENPRLIYVSCKGFLPGPYEHRTALDEVVQMMGGLAYMTGRPGDPLRAGSSVNDIMGGMWAAIGVLAALREREATGRGRLITSALFENNIWLVAQHMLQAQITERAVEPMPNRISPWAIYDVFTVAGGEQIFLSAVSDAQWQTFCRVLGFEDLLARAELATNNDRVRARDWLIPLLRERLATRSACELAEICEAHGLPYAPIRAPHELVDDPHLTATGGLVDSTLPDGPKAGQKVKTALTPLAFDGARLPLRSDPPRLGEGAQAWLRAIGLGLEETSALAARGVIGSPQPGL